MIGNNFWIWFMAGMIPSHYERKIDANGEKTRTIAALFWSFEASSRPDGYRHLVLHARIPFIGQLCHSLYRNTVESRKTSSLLLMQLGGGHVQMSPVKVKTHEDDRTE